MKASVKQTERLVDSCHPPKLNLSCQILKTTLGIPLI